MKPGPGGAEREYLEYAPSGYTYLQPWEVATRFRDFLKEHGLDPEIEKIVVAGKNYASFDARFLRKITSWDKYVRVHHRILDPAVMYWQPEIDGVELPDTKTCMQRAGISGDFGRGVRQWGM